MAKAPQIFSKISDFFYVHSWSGWVDRNSDVLFRKEDLSATAIALSSRKDFRLELKDLERFSSVERLTKIGSRYAPVINSQSWFVAIGGMWLSWLLPSVSAITLLFLLVRSSELDAATLAWLPVVALATALFLITPVRRFFALAPSAWERSARLELASQGFNFKKAAEMVEINVAGGLASKRDLAPLTTDIRSLIENLTVTERELTSKITRTADIADRAMIHANTNRTNLSKLQRTVADILEGGEAMAPLDDDSFFHDAGVPVPIPEPMLAPPVPRTPRPRKSATPNGGLRP